MTLRRFRVEERVSCVLTKKRGLSSEKLEWVDRGRNCALEALETTRPSSL